MIKKADPGSTPDLHEDVEMSRAISEAEKSAHEARIAELQAAKQELELLESKICLDYKFSGVYTFHKEVSFSSLNKLYRNMRMWDKYNPTGAWTIYLNSVGGESWAGLGIIDELISQSVRGGGKHKITIKVRGVAASAAAMILQAADHRVIGVNSQLMIHKGTSGIWGTADEIADEHAWWQATTDQMVSLFLSRTDKITRQEFLRKINRRDWWLNAADAKRLGFVDRIG